MNRIYKKLTNLLVVVALIISILPFTVVDVACASADTVVYITATGKCYHTDNCSSAKKITPTTLEAAVAAGLKQCSKCKPPTLDATAVSIVNSPSVNAPTTSAKGVDKVTSEALPSTGVTVWIPKSGKKYHSVNNCGNMDSSKAKAMDEDAAITKGYGKCSKCW